MRASPIERVVKDCVVRANVTIEPGVAVLKTDQSHRLSAKSCNRTRTGDFWCFLSRSSGNVENGPSTRFSRRSTHQSYTHSGRNTKPRDFSDSR